MALTALLGFYVGISRNCTVISTFFYPSCYFYASELHKISTEFALIIQFLTLHICYEIYFLMLAVSNRIIGKKGPLAPLPSLIL